ncbi:MAG: TerC family protein [Alphaproteobacteria bacterium]|nr:TerC family protein [Alphaproteobacteria bacterium]
MFDWIFDTQVLASFLTLALLEIILGIDNVIFLSIISSKLPVEKQARARYIGLALALIMRVLLLLGVAWLTKLTMTAFSIGAHDVAWRDIILGAGGMFLLYKGTAEIHHTVQGDEHEESTKKTASFASVIMQIVILDVVFSLDSVITAVGMTDDVPVMIAAIMVAIAIMMFASEPVSAFIEKNLPIKMLALSFLLLVGVALMADALHHHIPRGYLYFAIAFSMGVEALTLLAQARRKAKKAKH